MSRSYDHPQGAYFVSLPNLQFKTQSDLLHSVNLVLWQHVVCYMCELYAVQLRPAVDVLVVPYSVRLTLCGTTSTSTTGLH